MKRLISCGFGVLALMALGTTAGWADNGVDFVEIARSAPSADEYPDADGLYLLRNCHVRIDDQGREVVTLQQAVKLLTNQGRREFSDYKMLFDAEAQEVTVRTARTVRANFRTTDVEKDAINDITPQELEGAAIYSNVLEKVFSYPAALKGSVLALELERETTPGESGLFGGSVVLQSGQPIVRGEFTLTVPEGIDVVYSIENGSLEPEIEHAGGETTYRWRVEDVSRVVPESNMLPMDAVTPKLVYSTTADWGRVAQEFADGFFPKAVSEGELAAAVDRWVGQTATDEERIREIYIHLVNDVRSVELDLGKGGYEPNSASEVYHNRYGDCRDKAVLLITTLTSVGIDAYPVLYDHRRIDLVESVPTLKQFNHVMVAVETGSGRRFLDPSAEHCLCGFYPRGGGNRALLVKPEGFEIVTIPEIPYEQNSSEKTLRATVAADGSAEGVAECSLGGHFDHRARRFLAEKTGKEREMEFSRAANRLSEGATLGAVTVTDLADLTSPAAVSLEFSAEDFGLVQGEMMILRLPAFPLHFANLAAYPGLEERVHDFVMDSNLRETYRVELQIPEGYEAVYVPEAYSAENELGRWEVKSTVDGEGNRIEVERTVVVKRPRVQKDAYAEFKAAFDAVTSPKNSLVLLERQG